MKVCFLDIDGVLAWPGGPLRYQELKNGRKGNFWFIDPEKIKILNKITEVTGAVCVVHSDWCIHHSFENIRTWMSEAGFTGTILDTCKVDSGEVPRETRIFNWMEDHPGTLITKGIVIDDMTVRFEKFPLVQTNEYIGLTNELAERAIELLGRKTDEEEV